MKDGAEDETGAHPPDGLGGGGTSELEAGGGGGVEGGVEDDEPTVAQPDFLNPGAGAGAEVTEAQPPF